MGKESIGKSYYTATEVMEILGVKRSKAYHIMKVLKKELIDRGELIADYPAGKVPKRYFEKRCQITGGDTDE